MLSHDIPDEVNQSWYRGVPYVFLKLTATEPSSAIRNSAEIKDILIHRYRTKENIPPIILIYTDGGPEHRTNFLSVKIAAIALQKSLNADMVLALRTAPGHSFRNPPERVNCILNIGLYGIGVMRQRIFNKPQFERKLAQYSNINEVRQLIKESPVCHTELVKESCKPTMSLICSVFQRLSLKDNNIQTCERCWSKTMYPFVSF